MNQGISNKGTLIALACAAAFAAPQVANAQEAAKDAYTILKGDGHPLTLQGNISVGYARAKTSGSAGGAASDTSEHGYVWSGESNVRFSASSKLSQGFIEGVGFQVESGFETSDGTTSGSQGTLASRNTGLGLRTSIGTIWGGRWDTPMKNVLGNYYQSASPQGLGASSTGFLGTPGLGGGSFTGVLNSTTCTTSTGAAASTCTLGAGALGNANGGAASDGGGSTATGTTMNFRRRQANTLNYYTPNFNGFQAGFMYGPDEELGKGSPALKAQMWGASASYSRGPFLASLSYEKHEDYSWGSSVGTKLGGVAGGTGANSSDHAVAVGVRYDFGPVLWTGWWEKLTYSQTANASSGAVNLSQIEGSKYYTAATWRVGGPHQLMAAYGKAGSLSCQGTAAFTGNCSDTGSKIYNFLYKYQLDKVSYINLFYGQLSNDARANFIATNAGGSTTGTAGNGHKDSGWSLGVNTSF